MERKTRKSLQRLGKIHSTKYIPINTYRLQLTLNFTFNDAIQILDYLRQLGIEMLYLSPFLETEPNSLNAYKIINPDHVNPQLGGEKAFDRFCKKVKKLNMTLMIDFVPNHMGVSVQNPWWFDVLAKGQNSKYANFFDIDWSEGKVVMPFLHDQSILEQRGKFLYVDGEKYPANQKHYRLCHWRERNDCVNYRRFFEVVELAGLKMESTEVYKRYHKKLFSWIKAGKLQGIRIDFPDGLLDPSEYLKRLNRDCTKQYIVCEKILQTNELVRADWQTHGTVGYDMLNALNSVFVDTNAADKFTSIYQSMALKVESPQEWLTEIKTNYTIKYFASEIRRLSKKIKNKTDLINLLSHFPIYRSYFQKRKKINSTDLRLLKGWLNIVEKDTILKIQQLMPAVFAKGFEDTFLYCYTRLVALNEVGGDPFRFGITVKEFHNIIQKRSKHLPYSMITTSTHDTKRSLDIRMRIAVLSEIPERWEQILKMWRKINGTFKDKNADYFFYQTLIGFWPYNNKNIVEVKSRLKNYLLKAIREAKMHTNWMEVNTQYEADYFEFVENVLNNKKFFEIFLPFNQEIALYGMYKSLSTLVLKIGMPGVPDFYQGEEEWCYNLVDPDNRRPVDFETKKQLLESVSYLADSSTLSNWFKEVYNSKLKMYLMFKGLHFRSKERELFLNGSYLPIHTEDENLIVFKRKLHKKEILVVAPRFFSKAFSKPYPAQSKFIDVFTGQEETPLPFSIRFKTE